MNKLSKDIFKNGIEKMMIVFPYWKIDTENPKVLATWYDFFKDWKDETFSKTVDNYIQGESMPPTVKGLYDHRYKPEPDDDMVERQEAIRKRRIELGLNPDVYD